MCERKMLNLAPSLQFIVPSRSRLLGLGLPPSSSLAWPKVKPREAARSSCSRPGGAGSEGKARRTRDSHAGRR